MTGRAVTENAHRAHPGSPCPLQGAAGLHSTPGGTQSAKASLAAQSFPGSGAAPRAGREHSGALEAHILELAQQLDTAHARCLALARSRVQLRREAPRLNPCALRARRLRLAERLRRAERGYGRLTVELAETLHFALGRGRADRLVDPARSAAERPRLR